MKIIEVKLLEFNELSNEAKETAIEKYRNMQDNYDLCILVIDDCYLFEPLNNELTELFGEEYTKLDRPIIGNNRKVYFDIERNWHIDADEGIEINNEKLFLLWLGIPESIHESIYFRITNTTTRYPDTIISFEENDCEYKFSDNEIIILESAENKFSEHMENVLNRIKESIEYYYSDEYITQELQDREDYFTENGIKY